jgi:hypothetical protein
LKNIYKSYLQSFNNYAKLSLSKVLLIKRISRFARMLTLKANQLLRRAMVNNVYNLELLRKELFESGKEYVRKFSSQLKKEIEKLRQQKNTKEPGP